MSFFETLFDASPEAILIYNFDNKELIAFNKQAEKTLGDLNVGSTLDDLGIEVLKGNELEKQEKEISINGSSTKTYYLKQGKNKIWVRQYLSRISEESRDYLTLRFLEISSEQIASINHSERERVYKRNIEDSLTVFYKASFPERKILECNRAFLNLLGFSKKKQVVGKPFISLVKKSARTLTLDEGGKDVYENVENKLKLLSGEEIWILENIQVQTEKNGEKYIESSLLDISKLKQTQEELKKTEENLSLVINNLDDIIYNVEVGEKDGGKFRYVSPQIENILGITVSEYETQVAKEGLIKFVHPEDWGAVEKMNKKIRLKKKPASLVYRFKNSKTGNYHWIEENVYPIIENNKLTGKLGIVRDITQRRLSEEAVRISEKRYRGLFERNLAGVFRITRKGIILECNESFAKILGYTEAKNLKRKEASILYFDQSERERFYRDLMANKVLTNFETYLKRKDGTELWCLVNAGYNKEWDMIEGTLIDISELKITGEALMESERTLSTLLSNLPGMAYRCTVEPEWKMEFVSEGFKELTGYEPHQVIGNKEIAFKNLVHPDYKHIFSDSNYGIDHEEEKFVYEYKIIDKFGQEKWVWERGEVIYDDSGKAIAYEGFISDITDRKINEEKITAQRAEYQNQVDRSPFGIVIHKDGIIKYANRKAIEMLKIKSKTSKQLFKGYDPDMNDFLLPEYHIQAKKRRKKLLKGEDLPFQEVKIKTQEGEILDVETRSVVTKYEGEDMIQVVFNDITAKKQLEKEQARAQAAEELNEVLAREIKEHKETQEKLSQNQRFTRNLIDSSLDMILAVDNENHINEVNQSALQKFGYKHEELIGKKPYVLYSTRSEYEKVKEELDKNGRFIGEIENIDKNGRVFSSVLSASMIKNSEGEVIGAMGISRDITEIKDVERVISKQSSTIKSIFESNSNMLIWIIDQGLKYVSYNNSFYNAAKLLLGKSPKNGSSLADTIVHRISREERRNFLTYFKRALNGTNQQFETKLTDSRSNEFWLEIYLSPIILADGDIREIACLAHEITDKKLVERKMKESLKEKEILLKEVHHRVKNNLQVISSILNLQSSYIEDENTLNILRESQNRIKSMSFIHESLYQTKNFSSINFSDYIVNLTKNLVHSYQITSGNIEFEYEVEKLDLELDQAIPCGLIVNELVSNSLKYAFPNESKGRLKLKLSEKKDLIYLGIEDNGIGLPKDFDHENTNTLGLQLVMTLVEQLDGNMELKSQKGTNYLITFERLNHNNNG